MRILEQVLSKEWIQFMCDPKKGIVPHCSYYGKTINNNPCPKTCDYALKRLKYEEKISTNP